MPSYQPTPSLLDLLSSATDIVRCIEQEEGPWRIRLGTESIDPLETSLPQPAGPMLDLGIMSTGTAGTVVIDDQPKTLEDECPG
ncbi:MAG TPA: hypothetical protein VMB73_13360 [Acetobacteraceae bacterium]|nr:hypothetical protein [Acetobacteraceae bacterium]